MLSRHRETFRSHISNADECGWYTTPLERLQYLAGYEPRWETCVVDGYV